MIYYFIPCPVLFLYSFICLRTRGTYHCSDNNLYEPLDWGLKIMLIGLFVLDYKIVRCRAYDFFVSLFSKF